MNRYEKDIILSFTQQTYINQRDTSLKTGYSLGTINKSIKNLQQHGYLDNDCQLTIKAKSAIKNASPKNAIILAAGCGMRMIPINSQVPKALIKIKGEVMIERIINQLHEIGIHEIHIVVGFMKEQFEYLIDKYEVNLIVNNNYSTMNNLYSLSLAQSYISNSYIIPCDIWCMRNPFSKHELYSWYMISEESNSQSDVRINRKMELVSTLNNQPGNSMIGIAYLSESDAVIIKRKISNLLSDKMHNNSFWEIALYNEKKFIIQAKLVSKSDIIEINTFEQLREFDRDSNHLNSDALEIAAKALNISPKDIHNIDVLKKGMTNRSFLFSCKGKKYIMRIPGEGTDFLINRKNEMDVYKKIRDKNICDKIIYLNSENGYKITEYIEKAKVCNPNDINDLKKCMKKLKSFHNLKIKVTHTFDLFKQIEFYEELWNGNPSSYVDYHITKSKIFMLKKYIEKNKHPYCLTHIDAVPDNFLITQDNEIRLIDWEYAGMQDPHVDIAMFAIYSLYTREQVDQLIDIYFEGKCTQKNRTKIYCYIAICGLLWSNWCEYKQIHGIEFGEYSLRQYRYAKEYYQILLEETGGEVLCIE